MELMPLHIKDDPDRTRDEPAPADPAAAPVHAAATCFGILADGYTACTSKTAVTSNVNKTGKMAMFRTMQKPFCQACLRLYERYAAHCTCVACAVLVASRSATYAGCPPVSVCLLPVWLPVCLSAVCLSGCVPVGLSVRVFVCLSVCVSVCLSV